MSYKLTQTGQEVQALLNQIKNGGQSQVTDAVLYTPQNLEEKEQEQARKNIGAAAENQIPTGAVLYSQKQELESNQQVQARTNIGAVGTDQLPKKVSELENDAHYLTENQVPTALPQEASALKSGNLPTSGWTIDATPLWEGHHYSDSYEGSYQILPAGSINFDLAAKADKTKWFINIDGSYESAQSVSVTSEYISLKKYSSSSIGYTIKSDGSLYSNTSGNARYHFYGVKNAEYGKIIYTISDQNITTNSDILMELTDDGGVKVYAMEAGSITVIRDAVPTSPIPYTYKVKQTNASGQFTLVNHFVPSIPVTSVNGQTGAVTIAVPTKTSQLTNDSNFATTEDIPTSLPVTYKRVSGELPTTGWSPLGWEQSTLPAARPWSRIAYGKGKFVTIAREGGKGAYSTDGIHWTEMTLPSTGLWQGMAYGNGKFVIVRTSSDQGAYSVDGINWTATTMPSSRDWSGVAYGNGKFVAYMGDSSYCAYSNDGITWTEATLSARRNWRSIVYGNDKFVAIAKGTDKGAYSTDGVTWTEMTLPASRNWQGITYGEDKFIAIAGSSDKGAYSTDGITWTEMTLPESRDWYCTAYGNGKFVAIEYNGLRAAYSTDGITWLSLNTPIIRSWCGVVYGDNKFVVVSVGASVSSQNNKALYWEVNSNKSTYTISDTFITTNTSVKMYLTDESMVKALRMSIGSITVLRDSVPTTAIPYKYEVKQTSAPGGFDVINSYVSTVPTKTSQLTNDSGFVTQAAILTQVSQLANDRGFTTNIGTITQVKVNGEIKAPDTAGLVDLGNVTPEPTDWTTVPITTALENGKTYVVKLDTTPYPLTAIFTMSAALDAIDANVVGGTQQGTDGTSTYELKSATITVKDGKLTGLKSTNLVSSANPGAANLSYSESTFADLGITQYHYVELLNTVGGGGAASYKAIKATLTPSDWQEVTKQAFFVGEDTMQWPIDDAFELHAKRSNDIIGLTSGVDYTMSVTVDGQIYTKTAQMVDPSQTGGMKVLLFYLDDDNTLCVAIYDDMSAMMPGVGSVALIEAPETVTSLVITAFSGVDFGSSGKATITDSAIKLNSAVTLYVNTSEKISVGEKTNGSVTLVADSVPTVAIPYSLEIVGTDTEGLFELVNGYIPPDAPTALPQKTSAIKTGTLPKGENYVQVTDSGITANSDIIVNVSYKKEITGDFAPGIFALSVSNDAAEEDIPFTYKVKQTDGKGQFTVVNSYIPQQILPLEKNVTNESTSLGHKVVTITGSSKPYLFTVKDSDVSASVFVRLYPADENTETWLNEHTLSSIITEESGEFTFKVDTDTLPATFNIKYIIETFTKEE